MDRADPGFGEPHPEAPPELSQFAFLAGRWRCEARVRLDGGGWQAFDATWRGRYILDGRAIEDEYRMTDASGKLVVLGLNFRVYDAARRQWSIKWLNALTGAWTDLGSPEEGGVRFDGQSISYVMREPMAEHAYTRATYTNISRSRFTWIGGKSDDRKAWSEFMVIEAHPDPS